MKKQNKLYRVLFIEHMKRCSHRAWLYDTYVVPGTKEEFRAWFHRVKFLYYAFIPFQFLKRIIGPSLEKIDNQVDNLVGVMNRIPMVITGLGLMALVVTACSVSLQVHGYDWSWISKVFFYSCVGIASLIISPVIYRCFERCSGNFCADMKRWES